MARPNTWNEIGTTLPERVGLLAAVSMSGLTFGRSLMPRTLPGQALATGMWGAVSYGLVTACESAVIAATDAAVEKLDGGPKQRAVRGQAFGYGAHLIAAGVGLAVEKALPHRKNEAVMRATARTSAIFLREAALAGTVALAVLDAVSRTGRAPRHDDGKQREFRSNTPWYGQMGALMAVGGATAAGTVFLQRRSAARLDAKIGGARSAASASLVTVGPDGGERPEETAKTSAILAIGAGAATAVALVGLGKVQGLMARGIAKGVNPLLGHRKDLAALVGHMGSLGLITASATYGIEKMYHSIERTGDSVEAAYHTPPQEPTVSGGPNSLIEWSTLAREGRRFVNMVLTTDEISAVTGEPSMRPVRAFVGLESADTALDRAVLMLDEMERLGAFERSIICFCSPTGSGYVNPVVVETLEYLTGGDCASIAVQYSMRPSFLSLDRVSVGRENNIALLTLLRRRLERIPAERRPRLVAAGESLGAHTLQDTALHRGADGIAASGIDRALFIGTPAGSRWAKEWRDAPDVTDPDGVVIEVANIAEFNALDEDTRRRARSVLLTHHEDPIAKFGPQIMLSRPEWLDPAKVRPPGVPPEMVWQPFLTGFTTLADLLNADNVVPGLFAAFGHDYRADLAEFTRVAFALDASDERMVAVELALRKREALWAARRVVAEHVGRAQDKMREQIGKWSSSSNFLYYFDKLSSS